MKILLINAKKEFSHSKGLLNTTLHDTAVNTLKSMGHETLETTIDDGYDTQDEIAKILLADIIIYQMPAWWMGAPWILKKYIDEVYTEGYGKLYISDGRTRSDLSKKYGSGGLLQGKKYMLSLTWNAPLEAFTEPNQFFEGLGIDSVYLPFHKANQFLGMQPLATFLCTDVIKDPDVDSFIANYKQHLTLHIK